MKLKRLMWVFPAVLFVLMLLQVSLHNWQGVVQVAGPVVITVLLALVVNN